MKINELFDLYQSANLVMALYGATGELDGNNIDHRLAVDQLMNGLAGIDHVKGVTVPIETLEEFEAAIEYEASK